MSSLPSSILRHAGRTISQRPRVAAHARCFGAAVNPVIATARTMKETPYNPEKEGELPIPNYDGWNAKIQSDFDELKEVVQKRGEKKGDLPYPGICDSVVDLIGRTPMVRMSRLAKHLDVECEVLGKAEFLSAGGSMKDRVAKTMIEEAERSGRIKPGDTLIEPTSGNTGVGLCMMAVQKGYKMIICMPQKMSLEKQNGMKCLGGEILRTPSAAKWNTPESHVGLAARIAKKTGGHILDQYMNAANPMAHYEGTAEEIIQQCGGKLDYMVISTGTGGTLTGTALKLKEKIPGVKIVGVDPYGSTMAQPESINNMSPRTGHKKLQSYQMEGIGHDYMPTVLNHDVVDYWVKTDEDEGFAMARNIIHHEGLLVGGSCGAVTAGAYKFIRENNIGAGKRVAILLPDSSRNYMSKFMDDEWMKSTGFDIEGMKETITTKGLYEKMYGSSALPKRVEREERLHCGPKDAHQAAGQGGEEMKSMRFISTVAAGGAAAGAAAAASAACRQP